MSILVDHATRVVIQGITGREGSFQAQRCIEYGTKVVAGVTPGRGGESFQGVPVFNTVREAVRETQADCSLIFVPAAFAADAVLEAADAGIPLVVCITEGIPTLDMVTVKRVLQGRGTRLIGPNCPGIITPGECRVGIMPADVFSAGAVGVVSRSGTLVYEAVAQLTALGIGQSTCVGVGGDPVIGTTQREVLELFDQDPETAAVVLIGEIGGNAEQEAAEYLRGMRKPVVAFVAGATAPPGRRMGHAGAIIAGDTGTARAKKEALAAAGAVICESPAEIGATTERVLKDAGLL
ncbi:MAG: succinate--CoA ligase subunit alpha [Actinobacteria bacterium RBG_16_67_10]|nr:MAG: succinate--CoA ligase subunit alpha [Actinobacteria bacterium RBG_16_67_10]